MPSKINKDTVHFVGQASAFTVGENKVTNGDFASDSGWTKGTGWTTAGGDADCDGTAGSNTELLSDTAITTITGRMYRVQFEVTVYSAGNVVAVFDGVEVGGDKVAVGVYTTYVAATDNSSTISIIGDANFVGSIDNISVVEWVGDLNAGGGCTIDSFTGTLSDYMSATGGVLHNDSGLATENNSSNKVRIDSGSTWQQRPKVGSLVKIDFSAPLASGEDDGIYEITAATAITMDIDADFAAGGADDAITVEVWIGGAYPDIATAINDSTLSRDPDNTYRKRYICVNVDQEVDAVTDFVAETSEIALREDDGSRKIIGFYDSISVVNLGAGGQTYGYRVVSDMDYGDTYYGGAWQAFKSDEGFSDVRPNGKWIEWNGKGNAINILELNTSNFEARNIYFHDVNTSGTDSLFHVGTAVFNTTFRNCRFAEAARWQKDDQIATSGSIVDCYFAADVGSAVVMTDWQFSWIINSIINGNGNSYVIVNSIKNMYSGCLIYKGDIGIELDGGGTFLNCIFFDQIGNCINIGESTDLVSLLINNIFSPVAVSDVAIKVSGSGGSISPSAFNNIMYSVSAGAVLINPIVHDQITPNPALPVGTIEKDPLFVNPADGDFRLQENSPAFNAGMRGIFGGYSSIGGFGPYHNIKNEAYEGDTNVLYGGDFNIYDKK